MPLSIKNPAATGYDLTVYKFNSSSRNADVVRRVPGLAANNFSYTFEDVEPGFYIVRLNERLRGGQVQTIEVQQYNINFPGKWL